MALKLQIILIVSMMISILYIFRLISVKKLNFKLGLSWSFVALIIIIFAAWPGLLKKISHLLGIYDPLNMIFMFGFVLLLYIVVSLSMEISKLSEQNKKLAQEIAILRKDTHDNIENVEKKIGQD